MSVWGHELPRRLPGRVAEAPLITDAKVVSRRGGEGPILLKKVFRGVEQIFSEALVRSSENDVEGDI
jgi:hypothetical protein